MEAFWEPTNGHTTPQVKFESEAIATAFSYCTDPALNFSTTNAAFSEDDADFQTGRRGKTSRQDPMSHRIIEKRRRDKMNASLADLSRLIPQSYMRKGRGRVEKTEIIEMAIRHLKNLQTQECLRENNYADHYRTGFNDCIAEAAKFLLRERDEDMYCKMITQLREHIGEVMKGEFYKSRNGDTVSASSGSPYHTPSIHQPVPPLSHLREMLTTSVSDLEQSSDNHDVKDLSFRTNPPQQAPVITSSAASALHMDTSDYESTRSPTASFGNSSVSLAPTRITKAHINHHNTLNEPQNDGLCLVRTRKLSETSTDIEHCNNNYKFKNYIQQRFQQNEHYHSEESMTESSQCENDKDHDKKTLSSKVLDMSREDCSNKVKSNHSDIKNESTVTNSTQATQPTFLRNSKQNRNGAHHFPIPIFACHSQGFYVPLNVDYEGLIPYFDGVDVLSKTFQNLPPLHPIQIQCSYSNFNYAPTLSKTNLSSNNFIKPKVEALVNGW